MCPTRSGFEGHGGPAGSRRGHFSGDRLQPPDIDRLRARWWYIAPRNGHISILGTASVREAGRRAGWAPHLRDRTSSLLRHAGAAAQPSSLFVALGGGQPDFDGALEDRGDPGPDWFDAAVLAPVEEALRRRPTVLRTALSRLSRAVSPGRTAVACAEEAHAAEKWGRAARFLADALIAEPGSGSLWRDLAEVLDRARRPSEAAFARRKAGP